MLCVKRGREQAECLGGWMSTGILLNMVTDKYFQNPRLADIPRGPHGPMRHLWTRPLISKGQEWEGEGGQEGAASKGI